VANFKKNIFGVGQYGQMFGNVWQCLAPGIFRIKKISGSNNF